MSPPTRLHRRTVLEGAGALGVGALAGRPVGAQIEKPGRWIEVEPFVFERGDGKDTLVFREEDGGARERALSRVCPRAGRARPHGSGPADHRDAHGASRRWSCRFWPRSPPSGRWHSACSRGGTATGDSSAGSTTRWSHWSVSSSSACSTTGTCSGSTSSDGHQYLTCRQGQATSLFVFRLWILPCHQAQAVSPIRSDGA